MIRFLIVWCMVGLVTPLQVEPAQPQQALTPVRSWSAPDPVAKQSPNDVAMQPLPVGQMPPGSMQGAGQPVDLNAAQNSQPLHVTEVGQVRLRRRIPDRLVVLTFDDAPVTQALYAAPILHKYHFGATFYICEFPPNFSDKTKYMSWEQIQHLYKMGFEIGNHTAFHTHVSRMSRKQFEDSLAYIEEKCKSYGIPKPVTFAYPGYDARSKDLDVLTERGYIFARAGLELTYDPLKDNPLLVPGFNANGTDPDHVTDVIKQAHDGKIVVLTFHGIPDYEHPWVTTPPELFARYMQFLHKNRYKVIAMRDLARYVDPSTSLQIEPLANSMSAAPKR
jgi:peptidoglycan/xylan/chitin deacetylase (PgdA/CDA1 family)